MNLLSDYLTKAGFELISSDGLKTMWEPGDDELRQAFEFGNVTSIIAVRLFQPLQREIYSLGTWKAVDKEIGITEFAFMHQGWGKEQRYIVVRQDITRREKAIGKVLTYSVWVTNSHDAPYEVWGKCKPRANDENKGDFALGGFSMERFYAVEAAMLLRVLVYNLFLLPLYPHQSIHSKH